MTTQISKKEVTAELLNLETDLNLFDIKIDGIPVWERVRKRVHRRILNDLSVIGQAHVSKAVNWKSYIRAAYIWTKTGLSDNPFLANQHDIFFTGQRRKLHADGYWWDLICDPLHKEVDMNALQLETIGIHGSIKKPVKTNNILYLDFLKYTASILKKTGLVSHGMDREDKELIFDIENKINSRFDTNINIYSLIEYELSTRACINPLYTKLLARIDPKLAIIQPGYGSENLIEVCADSDITTIELQHGSIYHGHLGYSYPPPRNKEHFPDYLFTWGEFWNGNCEFPIPQDHVIAVGYPYITRQADKYSNVSSGDDILFISQGIIGKQLSKFAVKMSESSSIHNKLVYKLHPGEYNRWRDEYPWLDKADITVIDSSQPSLYRLFSQSKVQIGVGSTALYEGLFFDLETFIYNLPGKEAVRPLIDDGVVEVIDAVDDLEVSGSSNFSTCDKERFFKPNPISNFEDEIREIL
jgi:hypothetical protein